MSDSPRWSRWTEIPQVVLHPPHLRKTLLVALVVGTVLFVINQLDVVMRGDADAIVWIKAVTTYLVPFVVSNYGVVVASHEPS